MITPSDTAIEFGANTAAPLLKIETEQGRCLLSLRGAQVLSFRPKRNGQVSDDLLWVSPNAVFDGSVGVRGGIPVCSPWFGVNQRDSSKPKHGFLRNRDWTLIEELDNGVLLEYASSESDLALFSYPFTAHLRITVAEQLQLDFSITNQSQQAMPLSWALHSYHPVSDLAACEVTGLDGCEYLDNTQGLSRHQQSGDVSFSGELDRVYHNVPATQIIDQKIRVSAQNAPTAIVWSPGEALGQQMSDVKNGWNKYVCVERGAAFDNEVELSAGEAMSAILMLAQIGV